MWHVSKASSKHVSVTRSLDSGKFLKKKKHVWKATQEASFPFRLKETEWLERGREDSTPFTESFKTSTISINFVVVDKIKVPFLKFHAELKDRLIRLILNSQWPAKNADFAIHNILMAVEMCSAHCTSIILPYFWYDRSVKIAQSGSKQETIKNSLNDWFHFKVKEIHVWMFQTECAWLHYLAGHQTPISSLEGKIAVGICGHFNEKL